MSATARASCILAILLAWASAPAQQTVSDPALRAALVEAFERTLLSTRRSGQITGPYVDARASCIALPTSPRPDRSDPYRNAMAWRMDFLLDAPVNEQRRQQLARLDALVAARLLRKVPVEIDVDGEQQAAVGYTLTRAGWAASTPRGRPCFVYARERVLEIVSIETTDADGADEAFAVVARVGIEDDRQIAPWAQLSAVREAFPEVAKAARSTPVRMTLVRETDRWLSLDDARQLEAHHRRNLETWSEKRGEAPDEAAEQRMREIAARMSERWYPADDPENALRDRIESFLAKRYATGGWVRGMGCVALPGEDDLPVDWRARAPADYRVFIAIDLDRRPRDPVAARTLPYALELAEIGVLDKRHLDAFEGAGGRGGWLFQLAPALARAQAERLALADAEPLRYAVSRTCLMLGEPRLDVVDLRLRRSSASGETRFFYRLDIRFDKPGWAREDLIAGWEELWNALEHGRACDGELGIDAERLEIGGGGGSCWWAFRSRAERRR